MRLPIDKNFSAVSEIYHCEIGGNVLEETEVGGGELACCDEPMALEAEE